MRYKCLMMVFWLVLLQFCFGEQANLNETPINSSLPSITSSTHEFNSSRTLQLDEQSTFDSYDDSPSESGFLYSQNPIIRYSPASKPSVASLIEKLPAFVKLDKIFIHENKHKYIIDDFIDVGEVLNQTSEEDIWLHHYFIANEIVLPANFTLFSSVTFIAKKMRCETEFSTLKTAAMLEDEDKGFWNELTFWVHQPLCRLDVLSLYVKSKKHPYEKIVETVSVLPDQMQSGYQLVGNAVSFIPWQVWESTPFDLSAYNPPGFNNALNIWAKQVNLVAFHLVGCYPQIALEMLKDVNLLEKSRSFMNEDVMIRSKTLELSINTTFSLNSAMLPVLRKDRYLATAKAYAKTISMYEKQLNRFTDISLDYEVRKDAARAFLSSSQASVKYSNGLIEQCKSDRLKADAAVNRALDVLSKHESEMNSTRLQFEQGLHTWQLEKSEQAMKELFLGLIEFGIYTSTTFLGNLGGPAGVAAATNRIISVSEQIVTFANKLKKLLELLKRIQDLVNKVKAVVDVYKKYNNLLGLGIDMATAAKKLEMIEFSFFDSALNLADWDAFSEEIKNVFVLPVSKGVPGAAQFQLALQKFCIYAKALTSTQMARTQVTFQLVRLELEQKMYTEQHGQFEQQVKHLTNDKEEFTGMALKFYESILTNKFWFQFNLERYSKAFEYWAFEKLSIDPTTIMFVSAAHYQEILSEIETNFNAALELMYPGPVDVTSNLSLAKWIPDLQEDKEVTFGVSIDEPKLGKMSRVRLKYLAIYLVGAKPSGDNPIYLQIKNTGNYDDRYKQRKYHFQGVPYSSPFVYYPGGRIEIDSSINSEGTYFDPTPFSTWTILLPEQENPNLDLSSVTDIQMFLKYTAIPPDYYYSEESDTSNNSSGNSDDFRWSSFHHSAINQSTFPPLLSSIFQFHT